VTYIKYGEQQQLQVVFEREQKKGEGMTLQEILEELVSKSLEIPIDLGGIPRIPVRTSTTSDVTTDKVVLAFERECNSKYKDPGEGLHFIGLLLAVFAAEVVSVYWENDGPRGGKFSDNRGPPRMLTCLYSKDIVAFVLSYPSEVSTIPLLNGTDS
jgi:hypothetical protein